MDHQINQSPILPDYQQALRFAHLAGKSTERVEGFDTQIDHGKLTANQRELVRNSLITFTAGTLKVENLSDGYNVEFLYSEVTTHTPGWNELLEQTGISLTLEERLRISREPRENSTKFANRITATADNGSNNTGEIKILERIETRPVQEGITDINERVLTPRAQEEDIQKLRDHMYAIASIVCENSQTNQMLK